MASMLIIVYEMINVKGKKRYIIVGLSEKIESMMIK
jgi:hypothetical protein